MAHLTFRCLNCSEVQTVDTRKVDVDELACPICNSLMQLQIEEPKDKPRRFPRRKNESKNTKA